MIPTGMTLSGLSLELLFKSAVVLAAALALAWFMRRSSAAARHLWLSVAALALLYALQEVEPRALRRFYYLLAAAFLFFWVVGASGFVVFHLLALWIPRWGAAAIVMGMFLAVAMLLAFIARRRLQAIELPADTVRRRVEDHVAWWQDEVLHEGAATTERLSTGGPDPVLDPGDVR